jgi:hypothetical protein
VGTVIYPMFFQCFNLPLGGLILVQTFICVLMLHSSLLIRCTWGCLDKVNVPIKKKCKLGPKTMDCVFLGYTHHSIVYRFLVIKSEILDVHVDTFLESRDVTFLRIFFL